MSGIFFRLAAVTTFLIFAAIGTSGPALAQETAPQDAGANPDLPGDEVQAGEKLEGLRVRFIGPDQEPVEGVQLGYYAEFTDGQDLPKLYGWGEDRAGSVSNSDGEIELTAEELANLLDGWEAVYAIQPEKQWVALARVTKDDTGTSKQIELVPAVEVEVKVTSSELEDLGQVLGWRHTYVYWDDLRPLGSTSESGNLRLLLPPGEFRLRSYGSYLVYPRFTPIEVKADEVNTVEVDLSASRLAHLIGQPAPELEQIKGWKNGEPVTLADLRGKVVVLDFWGYWCGPCIHSMPQLMALHDRFADEGLVIIGVHDDTAESIEDMDEKLTYAREQLWDGRDLPFLIALDGGGETPIKNSDRTARGATTALYGIQAWPTALLIDTDGTLVGQFNYRGDGGAKQLEELLKPEDRQQAEDAPRQPAGD